MVTLGFCKAMRLQFFPFPLLKVGEKKTIFDCIEFYYHWKAAYPEAVRGRTRYIDSDSDEVSKTCAVV